MRTHLIWTFLTSLISFTSLFGASSSLELPFYGDLRNNGVTESTNVYMKFALIDDGGANVYWTNDGTGLGGAVTEPTNGVGVEITEGVFSVWLGDTTEANMVALGKTVFSGGDVYLRVWFSSDNTSFVALSPDKRMDSVPFSFEAFDSEKLAGITPGATGLALLDDSNAVTARATLGLGTASTSDNTDFASSTHTHLMADVTDIGTAAGNASSDFASSSHTHTTGEITGLGSIATQDQSSVTITGGTASLSNLTTSMANLGGLLYPTADGTTNQVIVTDGAGNLSFSTISAAGGGANLVNNETILGDWDNTANPWADNEVANSLTISGGNVDNTPIGSTLPSTGAFTTLTVSASTNLGGLLMPTSDGTANQVLITDGSGNLSWQSQSLGNDTISSANIVDGSITSTDIATGAVTSSQIQDGSISTADLADGAVTTAKIGSLVLSADNLAGSVTNGYFLQTDGSGVMSWTANSSPWTESSGNVTLASGNVGAGVSDPTTFLDVAASTTDSASLRIRQGTTPSSPNLGDVVTTDGNLRFYNGNAWINLSETQAVQEQSYFRVTRGGVDQTSIPINTNTTIEWTTKNFDSNNEFDLTNFRFQPKKPGKYFLTTRAHMTGISDTKYAEVVIRKNGSYIARGSMSKSGDAGYVGTVSSVLVDADGVSDYFDVMVIHEDTVTRDLFGGEPHTYFAGFEISGTGPWATSNGNITLSSGNIGAGVSDPQAYLDVAASTTDSASLRIRQGTTPSSPNLGDVVTTDGNLRFYNGTSWINLSKTQASQEKSYFRVNRGGTAQSIPDATDTTIEWNTIDFDSNGDFDLPNYRFQPKKSGKYFLTASSSVGSVTDTGYSRVVIRKNGAIVAAGTKVDSGTVGLSCSLASIIVDANGSTDYFDVYTRQETGGTLSQSGDAAVTYFTGFEISGDGPWATSNGNITLSSGNIGAGISEPTAVLDVAPSTTDSASLRIRQGTAPSSPNLGDVVTTDGNLRFYNGNAWINLSGTQAVQEQSYFRVTRGGVDQTSIPVNTNTVIEWTNKDFDSNSEVDLGTYRFQPKRSGKYFLTARAHVPSVSSTKYASVMIRKNGSVVALGTKIQTGAAGYVGTIATTVEEADGVSDYFDVIIIHEDTVPRDVFGGNAHTYFAGFEISNSSPFSSSNGNITLSSGNVGLNTSSPTSSLHTGGSFAQEVTSISSSYTADGESIFLVDDSGGNILIDLPAANTCPGRQYTFKKISAGNNQIILEPNGAETIDSSANLHIYAKNDIIKITNNGSNWYVIDKDVTPHRAKVICNSGVLNNVPDSSVYELTMDEIKYDNVGMADISGNGIRVKRAGAYHFSAHWWYNSNVTTETQIWVYVNGNYRFINGQTVSAANAYNHVSGFFNLEAGDLVTVHAVQKSGGSILLPADADGARGVQLQLLESP